MIEEVFAALPIGKERALSIAALALRLHFSESKLREVLAVLRSEGRAVLSRFASSRSIAGYINVYWRDEWLPIETMPIGRDIVVKTTTGRERMARRPAYAQVKRRRRGASVSCWSVEPRGDVSAVGWRDDF